ncbi:MAG: glycine cleavage system protein GcvH [Candidatus Marinimicrobia bacterium]|nr:glycine cleavage system protein GcvH [Candidatus Neomarinimicrobiota bacterium]
MNIPANLKYTEDHEWVSEEDDILTVGISDFAQGELGDIIFVEMPEIGNEYGKGDPFGTIEAVKTVADLFAPISGEVVAINEDLEDNPDLINSDAYGKGWIVRMKPLAPEELDELLTASAYEESLG